MRLSERERVRARDCGATDLECSADLLLGGVAVGQRSVQALAVKLDKRSAVGWPTLLRLCNQ